MQNKRVGFGGSSKNSLFLCVLYRELRYCAEPCCAYHTNTRTSCYTNFVLKNITITVTEETARWARRRAADENISVSKLVGGMLEEQMRLASADYWKAFEKWKKVKPIPGMASGRI